MLTFTRLRNTLALWLPAIALALSGCGGAGGADGSSGSTTGVNIFGQVSLSGGSVSQKLSAHSKLGIMSSVSTLSVSGCTVAAKDLDTNATVATGTTDSSGKYTLSGGSLESGGTYKIVATCGSDVLTSVASADSKSTSEKEPVVTNPRSTLIAVQIVQALNDAIAAAVAPFAGNATVQNLLKETIMKSLQAMAASIEKTIDEAIESGSMDEPTLSQASTLGSALSSTTSASTIDNTTVLSGYSGTIPASVTGAVGGAAAAASSLPGCDSSASLVAQGVSSPTKCVAAVAKLMYNVLGFPVVLSKTGALSGTINNDCSTGNAALVAAFKNATFIDAGTNGVPTGYCAVKSNLGRIDRNRGDQQGSDRDGGPYFAESGALDGAAGSQVGVITAIGQNLFAKTNYRMSDLDKIVFSQDLSGSGMNVRPIAKVTNTSGTDTYYYYTSASTWSNAGWPSGCGQNNNGACPFYSLNMSFTDGTWPSAQSYTTLASAIGDGQVDSLNIFYKKYGGTIPSMDKLDEHLSSGRVHIQNNPSGSKEFMVMYTMPVQMSGSTNPCSDNDHTTPCLGTDGTQSPALRVNLAVGAVQAADKTSRISDVTESASGAYYVTPVWINGNFNGVFGFIKVATGARFTDELVKERALVMISDESSQCGVAPLPAVGANCGDGMLFNATLDWSNCDGGGACPSYTFRDSNGAGGNAAPVKDGSGNPKVVNMDFDYKGMWFQYTIYNGAPQGLSLITQMDKNGSQKLLVTINASDVIQSVSSGNANAGMNQYNVALHFNCPGMGQPCVADGFFLVDENGGAYSRAGATSKWANGSVCEISTMSGSNCATTDVVKYLKDTTATYGFSSYMLDFDSSAGGTQSFNDAYRQIRINAGPIANPNFKCSGEPFYADKNGDGRLNCNTNDTAASGDVSFSNSWEYYNWVNDMRPSALAENRSQYSMRSNDNGYAFSDPVGTKKLLTTAFSGWFDGKHSLASTTNLDALQAFSLIFMMMTEGNEYKPLKGMSATGLPTGASDQFMLMTPVFDGGGANALPVQNDAMGRAFNVFHQ